MPDPNGAREFVGVLGPFRHGRSLTAMVYESPGAMTGYKPSYYFCCPTCGNCGRHWLDADYAVVNAAHHLFYFDHSAYMENDDGSDDTTVVDGSLTSIDNGGVESNDAPAD